MIGLSLNIQAGQAGPVQQQRPGPPQGFHNILQICAQISSLSGVSYYLKKNTFCLIPNSGTSKVLWNWNSVDDQVLLERRQMRNYLLSLEYLNPEPAVVYRDAVAEGLVF